MKKEIGDERSYGIIAYYKEKDIYQFLIVLHRQGHWGFPKGHKEQNESDQQAAVRELFEETGLRVTKIIDRHFFTESYISKSTGKHKSNKFFVAKFTAAQNPKIDNSEITDAKWRSFDQLNKLFTYSESLNLAKKVYYFLKINDGVIYQDNDFWLIDKPAGIETVKGVSGELSVEELVDCNQIERSGVVHRLDKDTSGVMVISKTPAAHENLKKQFRARRVRKIYTALVWGSTPDSDVIESFIVRDPKRKQAMKAVYYQTGLERGVPRQAITTYKKIKNIKVGESSASLLEVEIKTGRTHQIRVHMQSIGHPVLGDKMYRTKPSHSLSQKIGIKRQFLHAVKIEFAHPKNNQKMSFDAPLADDLKKILAKIE